MDSRLIGLAWKGEGKETRIEKVMEKSRRSEPIQKRESGEARHPLGFQVGREGGEGVAIQEAHHPKRGGQTLSLVCNREKPQNKSRIYPLFEFEVGGRHESGRGN